MSEPTAERPEEDAVDPTTGPMDGTVDTDDVEGHNLLAGELAGTVTRERRDEARRIEDSGRRHREMKPRRSLRDRLFGR